MKIIVLDAGDAYELDGFNKLLIKNPKNKKTILEHYEEYFFDKKIEIVVGYKAIEVMNQYPNFDYIYNAKWHTTSSSYSLALALKKTPTIIIPSDYIISYDIVAKMDKYENCIFFKRSENRRINSLNLEFSNNKVIRIYRGKSSNNDPELMSIFKISDKEILSKLKKNCINNPLLFVGENIPAEYFNKITFIEVENNDIFEINTPEDYIKYLSYIKNEQ